MYKAALFFACSASARIGGNTQEAHDMFCVFLFLEAAHVLPPYGENKLHAVLPKFYLNSYS